MKQLIKSILILAVVVLTATLTSCAPNTQENRDRNMGIDRLMIEECGRFAIIPSKGLAIDTALIKHPVRWRYSVWKLNSDSTRYVMCK